MEIRYPYLIIIIILIIICYFMLTKKKNNKYQDGSKIANMRYLKESSYYKKRIKEYKIIKSIILILFIIAAVSSTLLISRLAKTDTINTNMYTRDIFLCMDVSQSVDELNLELVETLKDTVNKLHGERFGISIFNTSSVILVPLTDDYNYVTNVLDEIKDAINANSSFDYESDNLYASNYLTSGTLEGNDVRGSSLIGDGLASCVYSFSNLDDKRTRIIILSTDNELDGTPLVSLKQAAKISKDKNIVVYGIGTKEMNNEDRTDFKDSTILTGGKFYEHSISNVNSIVNDIESTSKSLLKNQTRSQKLDIPTIPFITLLLSISSIIILSKKVFK